MKFANIIETYLGFIPLVTDSDWLSIANSKTFHLGWTVDIILGTVQAVRQYS